MTVQVAGGAGVAVLEMPATGAVADGALAAFAQEAMRAAAASIGGGATMRDVCAEYHVPVAGGTLRAEAIVMRRSAGSVRVAADVLAGGRRVASFEADATAAA